MSKIIIKLWNNKCFWKSKEDQPKQGPYFVLGGRIENAYSCVFKFVVVLRKWFKEKKTIWNFYFSIFCFVLSVAGIPILVTIITTGLVCTFYTTLVTIIISLKGRKNMLTLLITIILLGKKWYNPLFLFPVLSSSSISNFELKVQANKFCNFVEIWYLSLKGGMRAVIWTDVFQASVMFIGLAGSAIIGVIKVGSLEKVYNVTTAYKRLHIE